MTRQIGFKGLLVALEFFGLVLPQELFAAGTMTADAIKNGVHGYGPDNYIVPKEPEVRERLEWFNLSAAVKPR